MCYPDARPILEIHRGKDGYIIFARLDDGKWHEWSQPVQTLAEMFPEFAADLVENSFFSINTFWHPRRKSDDVRWLNAAFVDIDCKGPDDLGTRLGAIIAKADKAEIPKPSFIVIQRYWILAALATRRSRLLSCCRRLA